MGRRPNPEVTQLSSRLSGPSFPGRGRHIQTRRNSRRGTGRIAGDCPWTRQAAVAGRSPCSGDRGRGWAPVSGPVVYPAVGPALRLPFCEGTCISDPGNSAARHMPSCRQLRARPELLPRGPLMASRNRGLRWLWPQPSLPSRQAGPGVFPSRRGAHFRSLEIYQTPHTPLAGNSPHAPSCRTASRPAYEHQPCGFHGRLCG